jgi:hypothetical protein
MASLLCQRQDPTWWETGDDGNRLAIMLCRLCNGCPDNDPKPHGVIRDGHAFNAAGRQLAGCPCGYPAEHQKRTGRESAAHLCRRCEPHDISYYRDTITRWHHDGKSWATIARLLPFSVDHIRKSYRSWQAGDAKEKLPR